MSALAVVKYGDPMLRKKTAPVANAADVEPYIEDMLETMYGEAGMGLAANQVSLDMNFMVVDISHVEEDEYARTFINPEITGKEGTSEMEEGCLSVPDIRAIIERAEKVRLRYQDEEGVEQESWFDGLMSRVIQHEVDHLNGILFTDYLTPAKRGLITKRLAEIADTGAPSTGIIL